MSKINSHYFTTNDGVKLHYLQAGQGETLIMLPGGGFSAESFQHQMGEFSQHYNVISLDKRGQGKSEKVDFGYCIARHAKDLNDLLQHLTINQVNLVCHSLGVSVALRYVDLFGSQKIKKLVAVDEPCVLLINPDWSEAERKNYGAIYNAGELHQLTNSFSDEGLESLKATIIDKMTSPLASATQKDALLKCYDLAGPEMTKLYFNNICQDFRDVLLKLDMPTLFIAGKASSLPWQAQQWMQQQVTNAQLAIFNEQEGGSHFMFFENPEKFNPIVLDFLKQ